VLRRMPAVGDAFLVIEGRDAAVAGLAEEVERARTEEGKDRGRVEDMLGRLWDGVEV
jgi:hypothetical protein